MTRPTPRPPAARRGAILIVVLALLALFAVIGLSFVYYADSEATSARLYRESQGQGGGTAGTATIATPPSGQPHANKFLATLIFGIEEVSPVTNSNIPQQNPFLNALRGHELARAVWGWSNQWNDPALGASSTQPFHVIPFNGVGTFHQDLDLSTGTGSGLGNYGLGTVKRGQVINYTLTRFDLNTGNAANRRALLFDPEYTDIRGRSGNGDTVAQPTPFNQVNAPGNVPNTPRRAFIPKNAGYTYPDLNNLYLASISPTTGEVLVPSFHRNWLFNGSHNVPSGPTAVNAVNPNPMFRLAPWDPNDANPSSQTQLARNLDWVIGSGKLRILRPRPVDQLTIAELQSVGINQYPPPETLTGTQQRDLYNLIRDKIAAGDLFPYPVLNPDGTFTGDVQNLRGGVGPQRADSLWLDIGLPTQTILNGTRTVKPLVAALVVDLDGRVNINAHGNLVGSTSHVSHGGFSPAEVNLGRVLNDTDAAGLIEQRGAKTPQSQTGGANRAFVPQQTVGTNPSRPYSNIWLPTPDYLPVNWRGTNDTSVTFAAQTDAAVGTQYPQFLGLPTFGTGYGGTSSNNTNTADALNHPTLYNPADLTFATSPGKIWDQDVNRPEMMLLNLRYADLNETYKLLEDVPSGKGLRTRAETTLVGKPAPKSFARAGDLAHPLRMKVTTLSAGLDVPALAPTFYQIGGSSTGNPVTTAASAKPLEYDAATGNLIFPDPAGTATGVSKPPAFAYPPDTAVAGPNASADPKQYLPPSDFGETTLTWGNVRAALGPVDLNRPLTDYRASASITPTPQALAPTSVAGTQHLTAWADRHNLARDIFARLVLATGAAAVVDPKTGDVSVGLVDSTTRQITPLTADTPQFEAVRYLAQLAVNIVDYVDNDDVATAFVWNPVNDMTGATTPVPAAPFALTRVAGNPRPTTGGPTTMSKNELLSDEFAQNFDATNLRNCVVFGTEKPRLVLNEAYAEAINDTAEGDLDPSQSTALTPKFPKEPAHVRFWLELANPTKAPYSGSTTGAIKGDVYLHYDTNDVTGAKFPDATDYPAYSPYRVEIVRDWKKDATDSANPTTQNVKNGVRDSRNPTGDLVSSDGAGGALATPAPDCRMNFDTILAASGGTSNAKRIVAPNAGAYKAVAGNSSGFVVLAPKNTTFPGFTNKIEFNTTAGLTPANADVVIDVPDIDTSIGAGATQPTIGYRWKLPSQDDLDVSKTPMTAGAIHPVKEMRQHVVALRRLANPYLPPNEPGGGTYRDDMPANPYVTVDVMADVPAFDAIIRAKDTPHDMLRQPKTDTSAVGFDPFPPTAATTKLSGWERYAVGRVQPLAGQSAIKPIEITDNGMGMMKTEVYPGLHPTNTNVNGSFQYALDPVDAPSTSPFPTTCLVPQRPTTTPAPAETPWHTFGRHNGRDDSAPASWAANDFVPTVDATKKTAETLMAPFTWLPHADRPLVNSLELLHVSGRPAHELTRLFLQPPSAVGGTGSTPAYYQHLAPWLERPTSLPSGAPKTNNANGLYRALDLLRVRPWVAGVPMGGKIHGRVNINTIQDDDVAKALFDAGDTTAKTGSQFDPDEVVESTATTVATAKGVWDNLAKSRTYSRAAGTLTPTPSPSGSKNTAYPPGPTADDDPTATNVDRPFYALGSGLWSTQTAGIGDRVTVRARGLDDTILRRTNSTFTAGVATGGDDPMLWLPDNAARGKSTYFEDLPYTRSEAARKVFNNATTVSNGFAVWFTIGYFEVRKNGSALRTVDEGNGVSRPLLGKEAYKDYPGDLRQQYFAIVDRSNLTLGEATTTLPVRPYIPGTSTGAPEIGPRPAFTAVEGTFAAGATKINILATTPSGANPATATTTIYADGQPVQISNGGRLFVGTGATAEVLTVTGVEPLKNPPGPMGTTIPGVAVLTVQGSGGAGTGTVYPHATGERVCNALPGNPGPLNQTQLAGFDVFPPTGSGSPSKYNTVVPYIKQTRGP